jgi:hypothetical protein
MCGESSFWDQVQCTPSFSLLITENETIQDFMIQSDWQHIRLIIFSNNSIAIYAVRTEIKIDFSVTNKDATTAMFKREF